VGEVKPDSFPLIAVAGGKAMRSADLEKFQQVLLAMRARLRGDVHRMTDAALLKPRTEASGDLSSMPIHMADIGSDNFEQEFTIKLVESEENTLGRIEAALERIKNGVYGVCAKCGARIPKARLNTLPYAIHCVKCAGEIERGQ
jgi:RNA polymerase-binding transcription factor DksA